MAMVSIAEVKRLREIINATHIVVFAISDDGTQHVATHGRSTEQATEAAKAGNKLKASLGWPDDLCHEQPLVRQCKNCVYFKVDWGMHCVNGWTGDGSNGWCLYEPRRVEKKQDSKCAKFEPTS